MRHAYVFDEGGQFICQAVNMHSLESAQRRDVALDKRRTQKSVLNAQAKGMRAAARAVDADNAGQRIMAMHKARATGIEAAAAPVANTEAIHTTPMLDSAARAARLREGVPPRAHEAEVAAARALAVAQQSVQEEHWLPENPKAQVALDARGQRQCAHTGGSRFPGG